MMLVSFQAFWLSSNCNSPSLLMMSCAAGKEHPHSCFLSLSFMLISPAVRLKLFVWVSPIGFAESNLAVGNKTDGPAGRRQNLPDEAKIESKSAGDLYSTYAFHLFKSIHQSVVLSLLKCLYQNVSVVGARELINNDFHAEVSSELSACAKGGGVDGFRAPPLTKSGDARNHKQTDQKRDSIHEISNL